MRILSLTAMALVACGPPKPGPQHDVTYFWKVSTSTVEFNSMCSDDMQFRMANGPLKFADNSYVVYKASSDAKKATLQTCTHLDPTTCKDADSMVVFDVAGAELSYNTQLTTATGAGMCNVLDTQSWLLTDMVSTMTLAISDTLSLVNDQTACDMLEANEKARSMNMMGFQGCTITFNIGGDRGM